MRGSIAMGSPWVHAGGRRIEVCCFGTYTSRLALTTVVVSLVPRRFPIRRRSFFVVCEALSLSLIFVLAVRLLLAGLRLFVVGPLCGWRRLCLEARAYSVLFRGGDQLSESLAAAPLYR